MYVALGKRVCQMHKGKLNGCLPLQIDEKFLSLLYLWQKKILMWGEIISSSSLFFPGSGTNDGTYIIPQSHFQPPLLTNSFIEPLDVLIIAQRYSKLYGRI